MPCVRSSTRAALRSRGALLTHQFSFLRSPLLQGDTGAAGKLLAIIQMASSVTSFFWNPIVASMMDAWGRKALLIACPLVSAVARSVVALRPSVGTYFLYRVLNAMALRSLCPLVGAMLADVFGRGTALCLKQRAVLERAMTITRLGVLLGSTLIDHAGTTKQRFLVASALNAAGAMIMLAGVRETLPQTSRSKMTLARAGNPLSFLAFFGWTRVSSSAITTTQGAVARPRSARDRSSLRSVCALVALQSLTCYNGTVDLFRRQRYGAAWGLAARSRISLFSEVMGLIESYALSAITEMWLERGRSEAAVAGEPGELAALVRVARWSQRIKAFTNVHSAYTPDYRTVYANMLLDTTRQGPAMVDRIVVEEAKRIRAKDPNAVAIGQGELHAALSSLDFPISLLAPMLFSHAYNWSLQEPQGTLPRGSGAFVLCALLQTVNSELVLPFVYAKVRDARDAGTA